VPIRVRNLLIGLAAAVAVAGIVVVARGEASPLLGPPDNGYQKPVPAPDLQQRPDGRWVSTLLPFAGPFSTRAEAEQAVQEARQQGLIS